MDVRGVEPRSRSFADPTRTASRPFTGRDLSPALPFAQDHNAHVMQSARPDHNAGVIQFTGWRVYCFLSQRGRNVIRDWLDKEKVSTQQRADFQAKIELLENGGPDLVPGFITETPVAKDIYKAKIKGNKGRVQLRPLLCKGPFVMAREFTLLFGAIEKDGVLEPVDCKKRAQENRSILVADRTRRRHEGVV
jgi:hypothetical protein